ncbi:MAG: 50S ribosomal protein L11 methyltransferase, partial [Pirellulaceae bacterium]|nr:50S ribosomal protein L11 methyltransferase [Pirellulaceae bacterium]
CGTGAHPATQLCLLAMERSLFGGCRVLDVGTGTGILAQAAYLLGATPVFACDIEHASSVIARRNLELDLVHLPVFTGSVRSVASGSIDFAIANLNVATLKTLAQELGRVLKPGGLRILSGFREEEEAEVAGLFGSPQARLESGGWVSVVV